jgi:hypothetical protein
MAKIINKKDMVDEMEMRMGLRKKCHVEDILIKDLSDII